MANASTRVTGGNEIQKTIARLKKMTPQLTRDALDEHAFNVQAAAKKNITDLPAVDTGRLRASIKITNSKDGFAKTVGSDLQYAPSIEFGSRPHFPPLEPIREWCRRHGIPVSAAYAIALKIAEHGTPAKPFMFPAFESERDEFYSRIRNFWAAISSELA